MFAPPQKSSGSNAGKSGSMANTNTSSNMGQLAPNKAGGPQNGPGMNGVQPPNNGNGWNNPNNNQSAYNNNSVSSANTVSTVPPSGQPGNMNGKGNQLVPPGQQNQPQQWNTNGGKPGAGQPPMNQNPNQYGNQAQTTTYRGPSAQGKVKQLKRGEKKSGPAMAFTTEFSNACDKAPSKDTRDKNVIYWDHSHENFVYGEQEYDFRGKMSKKDVVAAVSSLSGDPSWNPTSKCEMCLLVFLAWVAIVVAVVIIIVVGYPSDAGIQDNTWVVYAAGVIAILFGVVLILCCREMANRLSWRKRLLMIGVLDNLEQTHLVGTDQGIRAGKEGAWIEYGPKNNVEKFRPWYIPVAQNQPAAVTITPSAQPVPFQTAPVQQSQFLPAKTEPNQTIIAPVRVEQTQNNQTSKWVEMSTTQPVTTSQFIPAQAVVLGLKYRFRVQGQQNLCLLLQSNEDSWKGWRCKRVV
jgi:hypothetical protein